MTEEELAAIEARARVGFAPVVVQVLDQDVPALIAEVRRLRAERAELTPLLNVLRAAVEVAHNDMPIDPHQRRAHQVRTLLKSAMDMAARVLKLGPIRCAWCNDTTVVDQPLPPDGAQWYACPNCTPAPPAVEAPR